MYDVPAIVDYVLENTETESVSVTWVGVGRGASAMHAAISGNSLLEPKINKFIAL